MPGTLDDSVISSVSNTNFKVLAEVPAQIAALNLQSLAQFTQQMQQLAVANTTVSLDRLHSLTLEDAKAASELLSQNSLAATIAQLNAPKAQ